MLDSKNEGFFSKLFDPKNPVECLKKGFLFNRRIYDNLEEEHIKLQKLK
jgi:hypothetical protein